MPQRIRITDVSPRDGLQNERRIVPTPEKTRLIRLLADAGVDEIEATSFVSPRWVPQLADAEAVLGSVSDLAAPQLSVLVPNMAGFQRALPYNQPGRPLKIALFTAASETFSRKNTNASIGETLERFRPIVPRAIGEGMPIRVYISCAVACPFEGSIAPDAVRRVTDAVLELFPDDEARTNVDIDLGDTIGVATPEEVAALLGMYKNDLMNQVTLHLHDTFMRAQGCVRTALDMGVRSFDASAGGLGGCPYATTRSARAPGNISTSALLETITQAGYETNVNAEKLRTADVYAREITGATDESGRAS